MVLTVSFVLSPVSGLVVTVASGIPSANLTPASRRQNHTTSPYAPGVFVQRETIAPDAESVHRILPQRW